MYTTMYGVNADRGGVSTEVPCLKWRIDDDNFCCGLKSVGNFVNFNAEAISDERIKEAIAKIPNFKEQARMYYCTIPVERMGEGSSEEVEPFWDRLHRLFLECGWKESTRFVNGNSGNTVAHLYYVSHGAEV